MMRNEFTLPELPEIPETWTEGQEYEEIIRRADGSLLYRLAVWPLPGGRWRIFVVDGREPRAYVTEYADVWGVTKTIANLRPI